MQKKKQIWSPKALEAKQKKYTDIKKMFMDGYSMNHISKFYGMSREGVRWILKNK